MKLSQTYLLQDIETNEFFTGIYGDSVKSIPVVFGAREFIFEEAKSLLEKEKILLKNYTIVVRTSIVDLQEAYDNNTTKHLLNFEDNLTYFKVKKLNALVNSEKPKDMSDMYWSLLQVQTFILRSYVNVLSQLKGCLKKEGK